MNKILVIFIFCFLFLDPIHSNEKSNEKISKNIKASSQWQLTRNYGNTATYTNQNDVRLTVKYRTTSPAKKKVFSRELVQKLQKNKRRMLASIGIKNWKVDKSYVKNLKKKTYIHLQGSYLDSSGKKTQFIEHHFYSASKQLQLLLTHSKKKTLLKEAQLANMRDIRVKYGL